MVSGSKPGATKIEKTFLILATSPVQAKKDFLEKYPNFIIWGSC